VSAVTFVSVLGHPFAKPVLGRFSEKKWDRSTLKLQQIGNILGGDSCLLSNRAVTNVTAIRLRLLDSGRRPVCRSEQDSGGIYG